MAFQGNLFLLKGLFSGARSFQGGLAPLSAIAFYFHQTSTVVKLHGKPVSGHGPPWHLTVHCRSARLSRTSCGTLDCMGAVSRGQANKGKPSQTNKQWTPAKIKSPPPNPCCKRWMSFCEEFWPSSKIERRISVFFLCDCRQGTLFKSPQKKHDISGRHKLKNPVLLGVPGTSFTAHLVIFQK